MNKFLFVICLLLLSNTVQAYNYLDTTSVPIKLRIDEEISTKKDIIEGQKLNFTIKEDVRYNGVKILRAGEKATAVVETVITSGMNGFPAEIIIEDFEIPNIKNSKLLATYTKKGQNRCFFVYPLKWALTPIPGVGSLTNFIKGGHAKVKTTDIITVYYYPNWE